MKKLVVLFLVLVLTLGMASIASANDTPLSESQTLSSTLDMDPNPAPAVNSAKQKLPRVIDLPGFEQLVELRAQGHETNSAIALDRAQIERLSYQDYKNGNQDALKAARAFKPALRSLEQELKSLHQTQQTNWEMMKAARQAGDEARMQSILNDIIGVRGQINSKLAETDNTLKSVIAALQG